MARVMIVDDEFLLREVFADILEAEGHAVTTAANAANAIDKGYHYDIYLIDIRLGSGASGIAYAKLVQTMSPWAKIILMSGYYSALDEAVTEGFQRIGKPIEAEALCKLITTASGNGDDTGRFRKIKSDDIS